MATSSFVQDANLKPDDIPNSLSLVGPPLRFPGCGRPRRPHLALLTPRPQFSATYVPLQPLSVLAARKVGPRWWLGLLLLSWGSVCMAHAAISSSETLIALRLLLGAAESGFTQTALYFLSTMYPKFSLGLRMGLFSGMYSIAGAFAGLIAYGLLSVESPRLHGWQLVFLVEGGVTVLVAFVAFALLPSDVSTAWFLNKAERAHAVRRMERDLADAQEVAEYDAEGNPVVGVKQNHISMRDIVDVLKDWKKLLIIVCNILAVLVRRPPRTSSPPPSSFIPQREPLTTDSPSRHLQPSCP